MQREFFRDSMKVTKVMNKLWLEVAEKKQLGEEDLDELGGAFAYAQEKLLGIVKNRRLRERE